jgi:hypothetical protein
MLRRQPPATIDTILAHPSVARWDVDPDEVRAHVAAVRPTTYADLVRAVFSAYAASRGKPRWGDKTPGYVTHLPQLRALFPDAKFVHVVRDGRAVAVSLGERPWGPASAIAGAFWWRTKAGRGRRDGLALPSDRYLEVRHEDLLADPAAELARVCAFLGEEYSPAMLEYRDRVELADEPDDPAGTRHLRKEPTPGLRDWTAGRSPREVDAIDSVCAPLLREFGYEAPRRTARGLAWAWAVRVRDFPSRIPVELRRRWKPVERKV